MSTVTDRQPEVVKIDAQIAKTREQERKILDKAAEAGAKYRAAYAKWEAEAVDAELAGREPKAAPTPPDETTRALVIQRLRAEIDGLIVERRRAIIRAADKIRSEVVKEASQIVEQSIAPREDLHDLTRQLRAVVGALDDVTDARQSLDTRQTTPQRRPPVVDLAALVYAVDNGLDSLIEGREHRQPRTLGIQPGSTLAVPPPEKSHATPQPAEPATRVNVVRTNTGAEH